MTKSIGLMTLLIGGSGLLMAAAVAVPEIDSAAGAGALALIAGALLVIRGRRKSQKK